MKLTNMKSLKFLLSVAVLLGAQTVLAQTDTLGVAKQRTVVKENQSTKIGRNVLTEIPGDTTRRDPLGRPYPYAYGNIFQKVRKDSTSNDSVWKFFLQTSNYSKRFRDANGNPNKKFADHLFLEMGVGMTSILSPSFSTPGFMGGIAIGDWFTPEHGVRLGMQAGEHKMGRTDARAWGMTLDYMMNMTALGARSYTKVHPVEWYLLAGLDFNLSHTRNPYAGKEYSDREMSFGAHIGVRGQFQLSDYTYAYVEPRLGIYGDKLIHQRALRDYHPMGTLMAGFGYRLKPADQLKKMGVDYELEHDGSFLNDMFFTVYGGPSWGMLKFSHLHNNSGLRFGVSGGKWFTYKHGARINVQFGKNRNEFVHGFYNNFKVASVGADYMLNLHNAFGGYNEDRKFWLNAVAGVSLNATSSQVGHHTTFGFGGGLQANYDLGNNINVFLEPRIDLYSDDFAMSFNTTKKRDIYFSLLAGLAFRQGLDSKTQRDGNDDFEINKWWSDWEIETGLGMNMPVSSMSVHKMREVLAPKAFVGLGKWLSATSGIRVWGEAGAIDSWYTPSSRMVNVGVDYMWNATNTFHGYNTERKVDLITTLGVNHSRLSDGQGSFFGWNASLKGVWHLTKTFGLYLEPQLRMYSDNYVGEVTPVFNKDMMMAVMVGMQLRSFSDKFGSSDKTNLDLDAELFADDPNHFVSLSVGPSANGQALAYPELYAFNMRLSYGKWFSPFMAWRANLGILSKGVEPYKGYAKATLGADLLLDVSAVSFGYDSDRFFNTRFVAGANLGVDYRTYKAQFMPDVHGGLQLAMRTSDHLELYAEPQLIYQFNRPGRAISNLMKFQGVLHLGLNYRFGDSEHVKKGDRDLKVFDFSVDARDQVLSRYYVGASLGTGFSTQNYTAVDKFGQRMTFDFNVHAGCWMNAVSGFRAGFTNTTLNRGENSNKNMQTLHFDYMMDFIAWAQDESNEDNAFQMRGFAGVTMHTAKIKKQTRTWGLGLEAGMQFGYNVKNTPFEIFVEPSVNIMSSSILRGQSQHPFEADLNLMFGTKYSF